MGHHGRRSHVYYCHKLETRTAEHIKTIKMKHQPLKDKYLAQLLLRFHLNSQFFSINRTAPSQHLHTYTHTHLHFFPCSWLLTGFLLMGFGTSYLYILNTKTHLHTHYTHYTSRKRIKWRTEETNNCDQQNKINNMKTIIFKDETEICKAANFKLKH